MKHYKIVLFTSVASLLFLSFMNYFYVDTQTFQDDYILAQHKKFMRQTLLLATEASSLEQELPFAAVLVSREGEVLHVAKNEVNSKGNLIKHAEIVLLEMIDQQDIERYRGSTIYLNTEPCAMCAGALDRMSPFVETIVFGCSTKILAKYSHKTRSVVPCEKLLQQMGSRLKVEGPVLEDEAERVLALHWNSKK